VGVPGGTGGNFQSRARKISLRAAVLPEALATGAQKKKKKKRKKKSTTTSASNETKRLHYFSSVYWVTTPSQPIIRR
jgi:hypothetical protein